MDPAQPGPTREQLRARVVNAFAELPTDAFDQLVYLLAPDGSRPIQVQALGDACLRPFRRAVADYLAAKQV